MLSENCDRLTDSDVHFCNNSSPSRTTKTEICHLLKMETGKLKTDDEACWLGGITDLVRKENTRGNTWVDHSFVKQYNSSHFPDWDLTHKVQLVLSVRVVLTNWLLPGFAYEGKLCFSLEVHMTNDSYYAGAGLADESGVPSCWPCSSSMVNRYYHPKHLPKGFFFK